MASIHSIPRRSFSVIYYENLYRTFLRLEFQAKLFPQGGEERRPCGFGSRDVVRNVRGVIRRPLQLGIIFAGEPGLINDAALQPLARQELHERRDRNSFRYDRAAFAQHLKAACSAAAASSFGI